MCQALSSAQEESVMKERSEEKNKDQSLACVEFAFSFP